MRNGVTRTFLSEVAYSCNSGFNIAFQKRVRAGTLLQRIRHRKLLHGSSTSFTDVSGGQQNNTPSPLVLSAILRNEVLEEGKPEKIIAELETAISNARKQMMNAFYRQLDAICKQYGQVVDQRNIESTTDAVLQLLEKVDLSFENGRIVLPTVVCAPEEAVRLEKLQDDPAFRLRLDSILITKLFDKYKLP